jgi:hypothetical protein
MVLRGVVGAGALGVKGEGALFHIVGDEGQKEGGVGTEVKGG